MQSLKLLCPIVVVVQVLGEKRDAESVESEVLKPSVCY